MSDSEINIIPIIFIILISASTIFIMHIFLPQGYKFFSYIFGIILFFAIFLIKISFDLLNDEAKRKKPKRVQLTQKLKKEIFDRADNRCQHCAEDESLEIHHIDDNPANNHKNNLILLCANCHGKVSSIGKIALKNESLKTKKQTLTKNYFK